MKQALYPQATSAGCAQHLLAGQNTLHKGRDGVISHQYGSFIVGLFTKHSMQALQPDSEKPSMWA